MASWHDIIGPLKEQAYFKQALNYVAECRARGETVYPCNAQIFNAFRLTPFDRVKVVILGQDPYHEPGQAMGLSFSVPPGMPPPPSLQNIYRELQQSVPGFAIPEHGCLVPWARQGVLLLNAVLTVRQGAAGSHHHRGWEEFTDGVLEALNASCEHLVFMLWGSVARRKGAALDRSRHLVLESSHPSPLSAYRGFLGCGHFPKANAYLSAHALTPINWQLPIYITDCGEL